MGVVVQMSDTYYTVDVAEEARLGALLDVATVGVTGEMYVCEGWTAEVTLIGGAMPAIAVYENAGATTGTPPRVFDMQTARILLSAFKEKYDYATIDADPVSEPYADFEVSYRLADDEDVSE